MTRDSLGRKGNSLLIRLLSKSRLVRDGRPSSFLFPLRPLGPLNPASFFYIQELINVLKYATYVSEVHKGANDEIPGW